MHFCCQPTPQIQNYSSLCVLGGLNCYLFQYMHGWSVFYDWTIFCFTTWVKGVASECESMQCVIHRKMLASRKMSPELNILQNVD